MSPAFQKRLGASPGKLALTAILALTFVYVLFGNSDASHEVAPAPQRPLPPTANTPPAPTTTTPVAAKFVERKPWAKPTIDEITRYDPFEAKLPGDEQRSIHTAATLKTTNEAFTLDDIRNAQSAIVLLSGGSKIARYDSTELRVGDRVEDYRVRDISPQGVTLTEQP